MGNLLKLLSREGGDSCCSPPKYDVFVDFESATPNTDEDTEIYDEAEQILAESRQILQDLENYKGQTEIKGVIFVCLVNVIFRF